MNSTNTHDVAVSENLGEGRVLTSGVVAGFVVIVLVLIATLVVGLANLRNVYTNSNAVAHTNEVKDQLDELLTTLLDAETGERGFVITGEASYLEPYDRATAALERTIAQARRLLADNADQQMDLDRVSVEVKAKTEELAEAIRQRRTSGFPAAQAVVATNVGKRTMDGIRFLVARMEAREDALLAVRTAQAARSYRTARATRFATTGLALLVVTALFFVTRRLGIERIRAVNAAERLRVTLASIGDAVIATDNHGRVTQLNPVAEALTGWTKIDAAGRRLEEVFVIINEKSRQAVENPIGRVLRDRVIVGLANHTVLIARNGSEIPVDDSAAPIKTADGHVAGAVLVFRDVTERRRIERERSSLIAELETAVRARDDFLSIASHELRNPVNAVQLQLVGILRALDRDGDSVTPESLRDRISQAHLQVRRLTRLLDNLLDVSRITAGSIVLEPEDVDLREVVEVVLDQFRGDLAAGQIRFDVRESVVGRWDRLRVEQIVANVLSNAIKYGNSQPIAISLNADGHSARLSISDQGIGIHPEQQDRLFGRFERGVSGRQYGGFGLGLWITRQLVEAMHGDISVDSRPGQGATFSISLPVGASSTSEMRRPN